MPREAKGPHLWWRKPRRAKPGRSAEKGVWVIIDNKRQYSTGCGKGDRESAERALAEHITASHRIPRRQRRIDEIPIADVLSLYAQDIVPTLATSKKAAGRVDRLLDYWGDMTLEEMSGAACRQFVESRTKVVKVDGKDKVVPAPGGARRELQDLQAAINYHHKEGLHREEVLVTLPAAGQARERWLTRNEIAALLWICLRTREVQEGETTKKHPLKHLARFILFALYTGSRPGDVFNASFYAGATRGYVDLEAAKFYRKPPAKLETKKRQPTTPIPPRLLAHLKRWKTAPHQPYKPIYVVEFDKQPVKSIKVAFARLLEIAKLDPGIVPYTFRATAATWMLQRGVSIWETAGFIGTSPAMIEKHYGKHSPSHLQNAAQSIGKK